VTAVVLYGEARPCVRHCRFCKRNKKRPVRDNTGSEGMVSTAGDFGKCSPESNQGLVSIILTAREGTIPGLVSIGTDVAFLEPKKLGATFRLDSA
jgi:hypothetical protein